MTYSIYDKITQALKQAENHNSNVMVRPEAILWPDPEQQWQPVIPVLMNDLPQLLSFGTFQPEIKQGPAIWIKCMIARTLPEADWPIDAIPIIYLPGIAKSDLRNVEQAVLDFQPLLEYQYTGTLFLQENGKEWSISAFIENNHAGLGLKVSHDQSTKEALKKALPILFRDHEVLYQQSIIDAPFLNSLLFPNIHAAILNWMCKGSQYLQSLDAQHQSLFEELCTSQFDFFPDLKNIKTIAEKLGSQRGNWQQVWQLYALAPHKYPELAAHLRLAKPEDLGTGMYIIPEESWPQVNEEQETALSVALDKLSKEERKKVGEVLDKLEKKHAGRRKWVWSELGYAPLAHALPLLIRLVKLTSVGFPSGNMEEIRHYYVQEGYQVDQCMRELFACVRTDKDKKLIKSILQFIYQPWLENLALRFQTLVQQDLSFFNNGGLLVDERYILFVDAFRYELAEAFQQRLIAKGFQIQLNTAWSAIPSVTPTAKPAVAPIVDFISTESQLQEFRPALVNGKELNTIQFREALSEKGYTLVKSGMEFDSVGKYWHEVGDIDTRGHQEQSDMLKRTEEMFDQLMEILEHAFNQGIEKIRVVTDHGWLMLPGGLPKSHLDKGLTETRWGRCALMKEGASSTLLHLPWRWNPALYIAYAPGISFFKANEEYAHGGISLQECLIPTMVITLNPASKKTAKITSVKWSKLRCMITSADAGIGYSMDIRTKYTDPGTSIVESAIKIVVNNKLSVLVSDDYEHQTVTIVLLNQDGVILDRQSTIVGE